VRKIVPQQRLRSPEIHAILHTIEIDMRTVSHVETMKKPAILGMEKIIQALKKEGYTVLLCVSIEDPQTGDPPRIAGTVTYQGHPENPQNVEFRTIEQMAREQGILANGGKS
jgi:hypothetical protein